MRRTATIVVTTLMSWMLLAAPALATEETGGGEEVSWDGLILAAVVGIVIGIAVFVDSITGGPGGSDVESSH